ncbi:sensor histidine kinase [Paenibacillus beijingensis]|uniref:histidine kinase n=1 Tax=Paenibacillus beijingensis TaxID=1126833 RepID=A0A0D5NIC9_9BACL|nr:HAMP domain-containing sensor histidine kinase [Paenibacillus beijingensis]AJY74727.1 hypothetical protein VN24_09205 [Paenibacillus beijingensis]
MDRTLEFVRLQKNAIIENWVNAVETEYPHFYDLHKLRTEGARYFDLMMDIHIPVNQHPTFEQVPQWCEALFQKKVPLVHIAHSTHIFRQAFFEALSDAPFDSAAVIKLITVLNRRIDAFEREVSHFYWTNARSLLEEKDRELDELHEDKLSLVGKMAASMAHEIRNPLTSIKGFIKLIRTRLPEQSLQAVEKYIQIIETEFDMIHMQITGFLSFSKKPVEEKFVSLQARDLIQSVLVLVNPLLSSENIELSIDLPEELLPLHVQKKPIQQVVSNLLNNGIDALRNVRDGKRIWIASEEDEQWIHLKITNNGPKIPDDIQHKLFQPFVTGREHGTGLGLTICKQIMENHGGKISFRSTENETEFILTFMKPDHGSLPLPEK